MQAHVRHTFLMEIGMTWWAYKNS